METQRQQFEAWITQPPSVQSVERFGSNNILVGEYMDYSVALAWFAWQKATEVAEGKTNE